MLDKRMITALKSVFRPLAGLMMKHGVDARAVIDVVKECFVEVAIEDFGKNDKPASLSRASELTGLTRREVSEISRRPPSGVSFKSFYAPDEAAVISLWHCSPHYVHPTGEPRTLEFGPGEGSFSELVEAATGKNQAQHYYDGLLKAGCIEHDDDGGIKLIARYWVTAQDLAKIIGNGLGTLANTIYRNWGIKPELGFCQRVVFTSEIREEQLDVARRMARDRIVALTEDIDDYYEGVRPSEHTTLHNRDGKELLQIGVGAYYFETER